MGQSGREPGDLTGRQRRRLLNIDKHRGAADGDEHGEADRDEDARSHGDEDIGADGYQHVDVRTQHADEDADAGPGGQSGRGDADSYSGGAHGDAYPADRDEDTGSNPDTDVDGAAADRHADVDARAANSHADIDARPADLDGDGNRRFGHA